MPSAPVSEASLQRCQRASEAIDLLGGGIERFASALDVSRVCLEDEIDHVHYLSPCLVVVFTASSNTRSIDSIKSSSQGTSSI